MPVSVGDVMGALRCEIRAALLSDEAQALLLEQWGAVITLTLKLEDTGSISPGLGEVTVKAGDLEAKLTKAQNDVLNSIDRTATLKFNINPLSSVKEDVCPEPGSALAPKGLDLSVWLRRTAGGMAGVNVRTLEITSRLNYEINFSVTATVGGGLTFKTSVLTFKLSPSERKRLNKNTLLITFAPPQPPNKFDFGDEDLLGGEQPVIVEDPLVKQLREEERLREEEERNEETTITVGPGQTITIQ